jgi:hypothetical protein
MKKSENPVADFLQVEWEAKRSSWQIALQAPPQWAFTIVEDNQEIIAPPLSGIFPLSPEPVA